MYREENQKENNSYSNSLHLSTNIFWTIKTILKMNILC